MRSDVVSVDQRSIRGIGLLLFSIFLVLVVFVGSQLFGRVHRIMGLVWLLVLGISVVLAFWGA